MEMPSRTMKQTLRAMIRDAKPLTAERLVDEASSQYNNLHDLFEWRNEKAAHHGRIMRAMELLEELQIYMNFKMERLYHVPVEKWGVLRPGYYLTSRQLLEDIDAYLLHVRWDNEKKLEAMNKEFLLAEGVENEERFAIMTNLTEAVVAAERAKLMLNKVIKGRK